MNSWDINLRDEGKYVTSQPSWAMIALEFFLHETGFLEEVSEFRDLSLHHHGNAMSRWGESCHCGALHLGVTPSAFVNWRVDGSRVINKPISQGVQHGSNAARMKIARKMRRHEWEMMERDVLSAISFIGAADNRVMIRFPRKKYVFLFQKLA
jgi:hypothetical protein